MRAVSVSNDSEARVKLRAVGEARLSSTLLV